MVCLPGKSCSTRAKGKRVSDPLFGAHGGSLPHDWLLTENRDAGSRCSGRRLAPSRQEERPPRGRVLVVDTIRVQFATWVSRTSANVQTGVWAGPLAEQDCEALR